MLFPDKLSRYDEYTALLRARPVETGKVLLYGSSFFTHWGVDRAAAQLAKATGGVLQILNHGFGGSRVDDLLYRYPELVTPYHPSAIVLRTGFNDLNKGFTPEETLFLTGRLLHWLRKDYPEAPIVLLKIFDTKYGDENLATACRAHNRLLESLAAELPNVTVLDLNPFFYAKQEDIGCREKLLDRFIDDGLHLTDESYEKMAEFLGPQLENIIYNK